MIDSKHVTTQSPCVGCGEAAPSRGHGLTRLRRWPTALERPKRGGFMGPYAEEMLENWGNAG